MNARMDLALKIGEASEYLDMHRTTIEKLVRNGDLPATKIGGTWFIDRVALDQLLVGGAK